jgi:hypothetical protein
VVDQHGLSGGMPTRCDLVVASILPCAAVSVTASKK